jgi:outer membrane protein assembly factor BamA
MRQGMPPGSEIDLGHGLGPRAFDSHAFTGTRSAWGTLEHRWFAVDEVLHLLGVGFAGFLDFGGAWYPDEPARAGGNVGVGLRLGATRATGANVGRLDLSYRFGDEWSLADGASGHRWVLSLGRAFAF